MKKGIYILFFLLLTEFRQELLAQPNLFGVNLTYHYVIPPKMNIVGIQKIAILPLEFTIKASEPPKQKKENRTFEQELLLKIIDSQFPTDKEKSDKSNKKKTESPYISNFINSLVSKILNKQRGRDNRIGFYIDGIETNTVKMIEREQINKVLAEQGFQVSGAIDESSASEIGKLLGADAIMTGHLDVIASDFHNQPDPIKVLKEEKYQEDGETKYRKVFSHYAYDYTSTREVQVTIDMKLIKVETGEIVGAIPTTSRTNENSKTNSYKSSSAYFKDGKFPPFSELKDPYTIASSSFHPLSTQCANYITPHFTTNIVGIEKTKFKEFRAQGKEAARYIKNGQIAEAFPIYKAMYEYDPYLASSAFNLGLLFEAYGNYTKALDYYNQAYKLANKRSDQSQYSRGIERAKGGMVVLEQLKEVGINFVSKSEEILNSGNAESILAERIKLRGKPNRDRFEVRAEPRESAAVIGRIPGGREYPKVGEKDGWVQIVIIDGKKAWISTSYVR